MQGPRLTRKDKFARQNEQNIKQESKSQAFSGLLLILLGLISISYAGHTILNRNKLVTGEELTVLEGTITEPLEMYTNFRGRHYLQIELEEYPLAFFRMSRFGKNNINLEALNNQLSMDKTIEILVLKDQVSRLLDYPKATVRTKIYGISKKGQSIISTEQINRYQQHEDSSYTWYFVLALGLILIGLGIFYLSVSNRAFAQKGALSENKDM